VVFLVGSFLAWFLWTQRARPLMFHVPVYHPPTVTTLLGLLTIGLLVIAAFVARKTWRTALPGTAPRPWAVAVAGVLLGLPWYLLMLMVFAPMPRIPVWVPAVTAAAWGAAVFFLIKGWSLRTDWMDLHRWALCLGALLVCMVGGFLGASAWSRMDLVAKVVLNVIGLIGMVALGARISRLVTTEGDG
jgi:hypothetical protein